MAEHCKQKWGFDFDECKPLEGKESRFQFERVPADQVPGFYRTSTKTTKILKYKEKETECCENIKNKTTTYSQHNNSTQLSSSLGEKQGGNNVY